MIRLIEQYQKLSDSGCSYVTVTLIDIKGSAPQELGAKMLVTDSGLYWGTVGGGKIEAHAIEHAKRLLETGQSQTCYWNLQSDIGMSCGGEVGLFFDVQHINSWHVSLFGAGHVAQELCRVLGTWTCQVQIMDSRVEWLERLPSSANMNRVHHNEPWQLVSTLPNHSFLLCMTMGHATDLPILKEAFRISERFSMIGVIGSEIKARKLKRELANDGVPNENLSKLISPLGLPIGNNTPDEIAVSIAAQLLAVRDQKTFHIESGLVRNT